ncbi:MAG: (2Fe-2S)-binding protein [Planctomycetota bacterium]|jgi:xanthine dehydrogenase YagT iron-sulfur-binding subunit|nr:(2Fe-2S)-binding protein [Planctomycetota bacterium]
MDKFKQPLVPNPSGESSGHSRRTFLGGTSAAVAGSTLANSAVANTLGAGKTRPEDGPRLTGLSKLTLTVNGTKQSVEVEPRTTLLSLLRHRMDPPLTGAKEVCDRGNCGACSVLIDDQPAYSCMTLAVDLAGRSVRTVEGLGTPDDLHPVQAAFCKHDASMCGFCTPGFVVSTVACLEQEPDADSARIRDRLSGNLCRCGTYPHVFAAAEGAQQVMNAGGLDSAGDQGGKR